MESDVGDRYWMELALQEAAAARRLGEVPVGAVLVGGNTLLARGCNCPISSNDPTAHAEIICLRRAAEKEHNYRLPGTTLYVTLEPCIMCCGAIIHARIGRVVFGATDPKTGALVSRYHIGRDGMLNHTFEISGGILAEECAHLLQDFFSDIRNRKIR